MVTIDERSRHQLYLRLGAVLGTKEATTLMEHLPHVDARISDFRADTQRDLRTTMLSVIAANAAIVSVIVTAVAAVTSLF